MTRITDTWWCFAVLLVLGSCIPFPCGAAVVGCWEFEDGTATDLSGMGHHGTFVGSGTYAVNDPTRGAVLRVDGAGNYVRLANPTSTDLPDGYSERTMVGWGKLDVASGSYAWIASYGQPGHQDSMFIGRAAGTEAFGGGWTSDVRQQKFLGHAMAFPRPDLYARRNNWNRDVVRRLGWHEWVQEYRDEGLVLESQERVLGKTIF